jgi:hypothetical protein
LPGPFLYEKVFLERMKEYFLEERVPWYQCHVVVANAFVYQGDIYKNASCELQVDFCNWQAFSCKEATVTKDYGAAKLCSWIPRLVWVCLFTLLNHLCKFNHLHVLSFFCPKNRGFNTYIVFPDTLILETKVVLLASSSLISVGWYLKQSLKEASLT